MKVHITLPKNDSFPESKCDVAMATRHVLAGAPYDFDHDYSRDLDRAFQVTVREVFEVNDDSEVFPSGNAEVIMSLSGIATAGMSTDGTWGVYGSPIATCRSPAILAYMIAAEICLRANAA